MNGWGEGGGQFRLEVGGENWNKDGKYGILGRKLMGEKDKRGVMSATNSPTVEK
jgi:hypothetical protein